MGQEFQAKKILLKNVQGDYLIPYTEDPNWGEVKGDITKQTDLKNVLDSKLTFEVID